MLTCLKSKEDYLSANTKKWLISNVSIVHLYEIQEPLTAVRLLCNLTASGQLESAVTLYLLGDILNRLNSTNHELLMEVVKIAH